MLKTYFFHEIPVGGLFHCNGNACKKQSSRTAMLIAFQKVAYFGAYELVKSAKLEGAAS